MGIATQPRYDDNGVWQGADIGANIEVEAPDRQPGVTGIHRCAINLTITPTLAKCIENFGYGGPVEERYIMNKVRACLDGMTRLFDGTERDADIIYDVIRLKMPFLIRKSVNMEYFTQRF